MLHLIPSNRSSDDFYQHQTPQLPRVSSFPPAQLHSTTPIYFQFSTNITRHLYKQPYRANTPFITPRHVSFCLSSIKTRYSHQHIHSTSTRIGNWEELLAGKKKKKKLIFLEFVPPAKIKSCMFLFSTNVKPDHFHKGLGGRPVGRMHYDRWIFLFHPPFLRVRVIPREVEEEVVCFWKKEENSCVECPRDSIK